MMRHRSLLIFGIALATLSAAPAFAQNVSFSIDVQGPTRGALDTFGFGPISEGDVLTVGFPGPPGPNPRTPAMQPVLTPGIEIGAAPGAPGIVPGGLGILPGPANAFEVDALSFGRDRGSQLLFSVDEFAKGTHTPGSAVGLIDVFVEGASGAGEAAADVFAYLGPILPTPVGPVAGNQIWADGDGNPASAVSPFHPALGLKEPNPALAGIPDAGDNLDALDVDTSQADLMGAVYFSLDFGAVDIFEGPPINTDTATGNFVSGADVLRSVAGGAPGVAIPAGQLGLDLAGFNTDDLDALIFDDADGSFDLTPGDTILFSVRRGSAVIGAPDSAFGLPIEEGDVLTAPLGAGMTPRIVIPAEALALATVRAGYGPPGDDLDALDVYLRPTYSIDTASPTAWFGAGDTFFGAPIGEGDILTTGSGGPPGPNPAAPLGAPNPGIEIKSAPGGIGAVPGGLGFLPGLGPNGELDALSYGHDRGESLVFSVDEYAIGVGGFLSVQSVNVEGDLGARQASADVFSFLGPLGPASPAPGYGFYGNDALIDGDGNAPPLMRGLGLQEPNPSAPGVPDIGDNVDALDVDTSFNDLTGPVYFSLDSGFIDPLEGLGNFSTGIANGFSGADILVSFAGGAPVVAVQAVQLGLDLNGPDTDDLDALLFDDADGTGSLTPGDRLLFSVRRASGVIGKPDSRFGVPIEEGDILAPPKMIGQPPQLWLAAELMGLATVRSGTAPVFGDDVDAIDVAPTPEPGIVLGLMSGLVALVALERRRRSRRADRVARI